MESSRRVVVWVFFAFLFICQYSSSSDISSSSANGSHSLEDIVTVGSRALDKVDEFHTKSTDSSLVTATNSLHFSTNQTAIGTTLTAVTPAADLLTRSNDNSIPVALSNAREVSNSTEQFSELNVTEAAADTSMTTAHRETDQMASDMIEIRDMLNTSSTTVDLTSPVVALDNKSSSSLSWQHSTAFAASTVLSTASDRLSVSQSANAVSSVLISNTSSSGITIPTKEERLSTVVNDIPVSTPFQENLKLETSPGMS